MPTDREQSDQDFRDLYQRLGRTEVNVAALQSGLDSLSRSTEAGFDNLSQEIKGIANSFASSRPNIGAIAGIGISAIALAGALAGFALKSSVGPLERDIVAADKVIAMHRSLSDQKMALMFEPMERRLNEIERRLQVRISDADGRQDAEIAELQRKVFGSQ